MTLEQLQNSQSPVVRSVDIAPILKADPQAIRDAARSYPEKLGFPVIVIRSRVKIPRIPFLSYLGVKCED